MKCDCLKKVEADIAAFLRPKAGDDAKATCASTAFMMTPDMGMEYVLQIPFRVKGSKKGYTSDKGKEIGCNVSYCPFCGRNAKRYQVGVDAGLEAASTQPTTGDRK